MVAGGSPKGVRVNAHHDVFLFRQHGEYIYAARSPPAVQLARNNREQLAIVSFRQLMLNFLQQLDHVVVRYQQTSGTDRSLKIVCA